MTVKDNLIAAKALIDTPEKWAKGSMIIGDRLCVVGAIGVARKWDAQAFETPEYAALDRSLPAINLTGYRVSRYNDHPNTTHDDIMALLDRAIEAAS